MIQELYVALLEAGVDEDKAKAAAIGVARAHVEAADRVLASLVRQLVFLRRAYRMSLAVLVLQSVLIALYAVNLIGIQRITALLQ